MPMPWISAAARIATMTTSMMNHIQPP